MSHLPFALAISSKLGGTPGLLLAGILGLGLAGFAVLAVIRVRPSLLCAVTLFLMQFSGNWRYLHVPFGLDDVGVAVTVAAVIYRVRSTRHPDRFALRRFHLLLGLTVLYVGVSAVFAHTLFNRTDLFAIISAIAVPYLLFAIAPVVYATEADRRILLWGLFAIGVYLGIEGLGETVHIHALVQPSFIADLHIGHHANRVRGPFLEASPEGFSLFCGGFAVVWVGLRSGDWRLRLFCVVIATFCAIATLGTVTRAVWIGSAVSAVLAMLLTPRLRRFTVVVVGGAAAIIVIVLITVPGLSSKASSRTDSKLPVWSRLDADAAALRMFEARPLTGFGWATFGEKSQPYYYQADTYPLATVPVVHNVFLGRFTELGLLGGGLWLISLLLALAHALSGRRSADLVPWRTFAIAVFANYAINALFVPLDYALPNALVWLLLGVAAIPVTESRTTPGVRASEPVTSGPPPRELVAA